MSNLRDLIVHTPNFLGAGPPAAATIGSRAGQADRAFQEEMRRITSGINGPYRARPTVSTNAGARPLHVPVMAEDFDALAFDYTQSAFAVGDFLEPEAGSSTPDRRPSPPYKPPPNAMKGFTRKVDEEDVVVCVNCGNELGAGDEEVTKQVWVAKQCGHVCNSTGLKASLKLTFYLRGIADSARPTERSQGAATRRTLAE